MEGSVLSFPPFKKRQLASLLFQSVPALPAKFPSFNTQKTEKKRSRKASIFHYCFEESHQMDAKFQALPPLKRMMRHLQQLEEENKENEEGISVSVINKLPTKKRKESRHPPLFPSNNNNDDRNSNHAFCLPAKKRVWALHPDSVPGEPLSPFDLNLEYKPPFDGANQDVKKNPSPVTHKNEPFVEVNKIPLMDVQIEEKEENKVAEIKDVVGRMEENKPEDEDYKDGDDDDDDDDDGILCAVCQSTDGDPTDPIVFCDGCDLMVHTTCYGNPLIKGVPEGDWLCNQCLAASQSQIAKMPFSSSSCCLCPNKTGAMKQTSDEEGGGSWAHVVCALLVPEVFFEDPVGRDGINCSKIPKRRWEEKCYVCKSKKKGCVIECSEPKCPLAFHVTCGLSHNLCIEYKEGKGKKEAIVAGFCKTHTTLWEKQQRTGKFKIVARE